MRSKPITSTSQAPAWKTLVEFSLPSQGNSGPSAQEAVAAAGRKLKLSPGNLERLKIAMAEATLRAEVWLELPVFIRILVSEEVTPVGTTTQEGEPTFLSQTVEVIAKVAEPSSGRGWGFFLIHKMKSEREACYSIELFLYREAEGS